MKIAIVGAGLSGLAAAWHLSKNHRVVVFDAKGIGAGASGASTGLLHPYPGEKGRRSWKADEAMQAAHQLLRVSEAALGRPVALYNGILKLGICLLPGSDVEILGENQYLIHSGVTVFVPSYLQGLWKACEERGVVLNIQKIASLHELESFDATVLCTGAGIRYFPECSHLRINFVKGQALICECVEFLRSVVAKQYIALTEEPGICHLGATYERDFIPSAAENLDLGPSQSPGAGQSQLARISNVEIVPAAGAFASVQNQVFSRARYTSEEPDLETAVKILNPKYPVRGCRAGVRVTNPAHYFPILEKIDPKTWVVTALGSRGLLYHGYMGQLLTQALISS